MAVLSFDRTELERQLPLLEEERKNWQLHVLPAWQTTFSGFDHVCRSLLHPRKVLQQTQYSLVLLLEQDGRQFIAKRSLTQERRFWTQLTSLYRKGSATRMMRTLQQMYEDGLPVPEPVLVLEKKRWGMTLVSWGVYRYLEGETCRFEHSAQIAETLQSLHAKGWIHRDPHVWNFLFHQGQIRILDCERARPWTSTYAQMYDVVLLDKCSPGSAAFYGVSTDNRVYRLAKFQNTQLQRWRRAKRVIRFWRKNPADGKGDDRSE
ncbi:hypothetical protein CSB45_03870 [candidate division KSB3 bacterium]|uniref:Uncharacterized protein n=1 Tax=candidate division KSB3 bacterium TaxID=2044937 RepID=A0A2G6E841_9BACT|nr:MAG: hypothetical protein CSB45_03870 [candidate division KSB3 bacterium]PIE30518.1 MAG: hypothetical protein CSA57_02455 [candidate division KSB3 bacterium]